VGEFNILSLFDGLSCAQIALNKAGIKYNNYFASEIDRYCIQITQKNYPNTIQLGDITNIKGNNLPKIDLIVGGSPCQGFSFAGKQLNFNDPRSALFFEYVRLLKECNPNFFLFENVKMKKEYIDIISKFLNKPPIHINSDIFVCQNRYRLYWTNIKLNTLPIRPRWNNEYYQLRRTYMRKNKSGVCPILTANMGTGGHNVPLKKLSEIIESGKVDRDVAFCIDACYYKGSTLRNYYDKYRRQIVFDGDTFRKLTPIECERLQTIPDNYTNGVSNTQRYKMIGNGMTVDVIAHIFKGLKNI